MKGNSHCMMWQLAWEIHEPIFVATESTRAADWWLLAMRESSQSKDANPGEWLAPHPMQCLNFSPFSSETVLRNPTRHKSSSSLKDRGHAFGFGRPPLSRNHSRKAPKTGPFETTSVADR